MIGLLKKIIPKDFLVYWYRRLYTIYLRNLKVNFVKKKKTIVFFNHFYSQDVKALSNQFEDKDYGTIDIDTSELFKCAKIFFEKKVQDLNEPYPDEGVYTEKFKYESERIFKLIDTLFGIDILILPSDNYYWVREFIKLCLGKIPVIVVDKEGLISPYDFNAESDRIKKFAPPISDFYYVWSMRQKDYWIKAGLDEKKILVTGQPRSDLLFEENKTKTQKNKKQLTFFTYDDDAYIPPRFVKEGFSWKKMKRDTHEILLDFSKAFPGWNIIIKTHPQQRDLQELKNTYNRDNLTVIGGSKDSNYLIKNSDLIVCFQSTVLLESLIMNVPVFYTYWAEMPVGLSEEILQFADNKAVNVIKSKENFKSAIYNLAEKNLIYDIQKDNNYIQKEFISKFFYRVNGSVSKNIVEDIIERFSI